MTGIKSYLFFWTGQFMYIGKAMNTSIHDHHAIQIALSFDSFFTIQLRDQSSLNVKAAIIDSDQPHECRTNDATFLLLNIDPETNIGKALKRLYFTHQGIAELATEHTAEFIQEIEKCLTGNMLNGRFIYEITRQFLSKLSLVQDTGIIDERISEVLKLLNNVNDAAIKVNDLAGKVFMSQSRLIHLFKEQVGIPIRKYILWTKVLLVLKKVFETKNIREAAFYAGFSDAPHFNRTFKKMFGLHPTSILKNSQNVQAFFE